MKMVRSCHELSHKLIAYELSSRVLVKKIRLQTICQYNVSWEEELEIHFKRSVDWSWMKKTRHFS